MRRLTTAASVCTLLLAAASVRGEAQAAPAPHTVVLRGSDLAVVKARLASHDTTLAPALARLVRDADKALAAPLVAVTQKRRMLAPTNDPHDYLSLSPYWWPDPAKPDGLPYIRRDGETNPESKADLDQPRVAQMGGNVQALALAWYYTGDARYAKRGGEQLRAWFLDSATHMNPHLRFSQLVRGNPEERGSGIIDTRWFTEAVDAAELLRGSPGWSEADHAALQGWMRQYLEWLRTSRNGRHEHDARNNHGSWYAAQMATLALFTGDTALARSIATDAKARIGWQVMPDGSQPLELERTRSMHYSAFNAEALSRLAQIGGAVGVDLWRYEAPTGGSLRRALDRLATYAPVPATWPGQQIDAIDMSDVVRVLRRADAALGQPVYRDVLAKLDPKLVNEDRSALLYR